MELCAFFNKLGFSLYAVLPVCHLVIALDIEMKLNRENSDRGKCVNLT